MARFAWTPAFAALLALAPAQATAEHQGQSDSDVRPLRGGAGMSLSAGMGVTGFSDDRIAALTNVGLGWDLRFLWGTRRPVGVEVGYAGTLRRAEAADLGENATLLSSELGSALRLQFGVDTWQPYVFVGLGWKRFELLDQAGGADALSMRDGDWIVAVTWHPGIKPLVRRQDYPGRLGPPGAATTSPQPGGVYRPSYPQPCRARAWVGPARHGDG